MFRDAFVEHVWLTDASTGLPAGGQRSHYDEAIPFDRDLNVQQWPSKEAWLTRKWIRHAARQAENRTAFDNYQVLFAVARCSVTNPYPAFLTPRENNVHSVIPSVPRDLGGRGARHLRRAPPSRSLATLGMTGSTRCVRNAGYAGLTTVAGGFNDTWFYTEAYGSPTAVAEGTAHELAHQWLVNRQTPNGNDHGGHCDEDTAPPQTYDIHDKPQLCLMTSTVFNTAEASDGIVGFHFVAAGGSPHSEYLQIRRRPEPVPQNERPRPPLQ